MTREETAKILSSLRAAFPNGYRDLSKADYVAMMDVWMDQFKSDSYESVSKAVRSIIATSTSEWPPVIGAVKEEMTKQRSERPTEEEAWLAVRKACRNGLYNSEKEFKKLHPAIQAAVGGAWQIKEWANCTDADMERISHSFKKTYRSITETEIRAEKLPEDVKTFASGVADRLRLGNG